ncbi:hypothetical protein [Streptomyces sp. WAC08241]|uniref:hypothetical protein n=1 Tax=Streptomyces sp. WAC08241 TaxID=2487421 RepID=UPI000F79A7E6|nr:hypothetical protein [Streptomyces sp. WAC08241]RSS38938.1 hypothetical protein EF906_19920 [Streptomyces sp. WAC08241]
MTTPHLDEEPPEHRRFARYLEALEAVPEEAEAELVSAVLCDRDATMAGSAVVRHLDRRAAGLLTGPHFTPWARRLAGAVAAHDFPARRLREWSLLHALVRDGAWSPGELLDASDWLQRTAASRCFATPPTALALLAERGRTRRVRNEASRMPRHGPDLRGRSSAHGPPV